MDEDDGYYGKDRHHLGSRRPLHAEDAVACLMAPEAPTPRPTDPAGTSASPPTIEVRSDVADQPHGHHLPRGQVPRDPRSLDLPPANGMSNHESQYDKCHSHNHAHHSHFSSTRKMDFPMFDGEDYQVWIDIMTYILRFIGS